MIKKLGETLKHYRHRVIEAAFLEQVRQHPATEMTARRERPLLPTYICIRPDGEPWLDKRGKLMRFGKAWQAVGWLEHKARKPGSGKLRPLKGTNTVRGGYVYRYPEYPVFWLIPSDVWLSTPRRIRVWKGMQRLKSKALFRSAIGSQYAVGVLPN